MYGSQRLHINKLSPKRCFNISIRPKLKIGAFCISSTYLCINRKIEQLQVDDEKLIQI